ncbi:MAG: hypothetical protein HYX78_02335 [Armatimonadetes bacterium]|nr:hypothetical protein [Armatimonadota bacterium]
MALEYILWSGGQLRQGEIIVGLYEYEYESLAGTQTDPGTENPVQQITIVEHPRVIIVSQDCDLEQDYAGRQGQASSDKLLQHVLMCDMYEKDEIRGRSALNSALFRRVNQNQDERYHRFDNAPVGNSDRSLPELYVDFKRILSLPTGFVYDLLYRNEAQRVALVPGLYLHDFVHRLYSFLGRVAT